MDDRAAARPDLPVEEAVFLTLLCYNALLVWRGAERVLAARRGEDDA